jgi:hypothetical protein
VGSNGSSLAYQRFDAMESTVGGPLTVAGEAPGGVLIGGGGGEAMIVWVNGTALRARGVNASGAFAGAAFELGAATVDGSASGAVLRTGSKFAVVWTGHVGDEYATWFATVSTTAVLTQPVKTISTATNHQVVAMAPLADGYGYALALTAEVPTRTAVSLVIDDEGLVLGSGYKLLGTSESYDIAVQGDGIGIVARRATGEIQFRSLDFNANPLGAWICLAGPNNDIYSRAAIDPIEGGYAVVYRTAAQGLALSELDTFGSPAR